MKLLISFEIVMYTYGTVETKRWKQLEKQGLAVVGFAWPWPRSFALSLVCCSISFRDMSAFLHHYETTSRELQLTIFCLWLLTGGMGCFCITSSINCKLLYCKTGQPFWNASIHGRIAEHWHQTYQQANHRAWQITREKRKSVFHFQLFKYKIVVDRSNSV